MGAVRGALVDVGVVVGSSASPAETRGSGTAPEILGMWGSARASHGWEMIRMKARREVAANRAAARSRDMVNDEFICWTFIS